MSNNNELSHELKDVDLENIIRGSSNSEFSPNKSVIGLVVIVLLVVSLFSAFIIYIVFNTDLLMDQTSDIVGGITCDRPRSDMIDASNAPCCGDSGFNVNSLIRYLADKEMTVGTNAVGYLTVCNGYCSESTGNGCKDSTENKKYQQCINELKPVPSTCGPAMPVAYIGATKYYGQKGGPQAISSCSQHCKCGLITCDPVE